jgi:predicted nucleic acid-binding protein
VESIAVEELKELIVADGARMIGARQEILSGIRNPEQFEKLRVFLCSFVDVPTDTSDFEAAAQMSNQCRGEGITVSIVAALICATARLAHLYHGRGFRTSLVFCR